jgi:Putative transposase
MLMVSQASSRAKWLAERQAELLPVPYFHVVFTLPQQIGGLALQNAREIYGILFRAASETLLSIAADPKRLGAAIGFLAVLLTRSEAAWSTYPGIRSALVCANGQWGQNLHLHPHLHCVVPGGGIGPDGASWVGCRRSSFLLPREVLSCRFRNLFLTYLKQAFEEGKLRFHGEMAGLARPAAFAALCTRARRIKWVVHAKAPFGGSEQVLKYLARYTHRVAISNSRILSIECGKVTFLWKDYAGGNQTKAMTLDAVEFIRRFLLHVLPRGFVRIRQFGFLANRARRGKLVQCRVLLAIPAAPAKDAATDQREGKIRDKLCPACKTGHMILTRIFQTAPPARQDSS